MMTNSIMRVNMIDKISSVQRVYRLQKEQENEARYRHTSKAVVVGIKEESAKLPDQEHGTTLEFSRMLEEEYLRQRYARLLTADPVAIEGCRQNSLPFMDNCGNKARSMQAAAAYEANFMYIET